MNGVKCFVWDGLSEICFLMQKSLSITLGLDHSLVNICYSVTGLLIQEWHFLHSEFCILRSCSCETLSVKLSSVYHTNCKCSSSSEYFSVSVAETADIFYHRCIYFCHQYGYTAAFILNTSLKWQKCKHTFHHLNQGCTNIVCEVNPGN